jgi:hypothetical protein
MTLIEHVFVDLRKPYPSLRPVPHLDVNPLITNVETETGPGGFLTLRIGLLSDEDAFPKIYPSLESPVDVDYGYHVTAKIGDHVIFEGIVEEIALDRTGFTATGYGVAASNWGTVDTTSEDRVETQKIALAAAAAIPWWTIGSLPTPDSPSYRAWSEVQYLSTSQVLDALTKEGSGGTPWLWHVWEDRVLQIRERTIPTKPTYQLSYDRQVMHVRGNSSEVVDAVRASYRDDNGVPQVTGWLFRDGFDRTSALRREKTVPASGPVSTMMQYLQTWMAEHSQPRLVGSIRLENGQGLTLASGLEVPGYTVRYGQSVGLEGFGERGVTYISRTTCNFSTGAVAIDLDTPSPSSLAGLLGRLQELDYSIRTGRDPVTGNRL